MLKINRQNHLIFLNKKRKLQYSFMLLLMKKYKLKLNFIKPYAQLQKKQLIVNKVNKKHKKKVLTLKKNYLAITPETVNFLTYKLKVLDTYILRNKLFINNYLRAGSFIWNILIQSLKTTNFFQNELLFRELNLKNDFQETRIKDFIQFLFLKNSGSLIFQIFEKYQLKQKLLVEFLSLNNAGSLNIFDTLNHDSTLLFKNVKGTDRFFADHSKVLLPWQLNALKKLNFYNPNRISFLTDLGKLTTYPQKYSYILFEPVEGDDPVPDEIDFTLYEIGESNTTTYSISLDNDTDYLGPYIDGKENLTTVPFDEGKSLIEEYRVLQFFQKHKYPRFRWSDGKLKKYHFASLFSNIPRKRLNHNFAFWSNYLLTDLFDFNLKVLPQTVSGIEINKLPYITANDHESFFTDGGFFDEDFVADEKLITSLLYMDKSYYQFPSDFFFFWQWKQLLTANYYSFNFGETYSKYLDLLKLKYLSSYSYYVFKNKSWKHFLYNKHLFFSNQRLSITKKKYENFSTLQKHEFRLYDPIPLILFEKSLLKESTEFEQLFGVKQQLPFLLTNINNLSQNSFYNNFLQIKKIRQIEYEHLKVAEKSGKDFIKNLEFKQNLFDERLFKNWVKAEKHKQKDDKKTAGDVKFAFRPFEHTASSQWLYYYFPRSNYRHKQNERIISFEIDSFFFVNYSNYNDTHSIFKQFDFLTFNTFENSFPIFDNLETINEQNISFIAKTDILNQFTWTNWPISLFELLHENLGFFCHPFYNQFQQLLYKNFFKFLLLVFIHEDKKEKLTLQTFWTNQTIIAQRSGIKQRLILNLFLEKIDFSEDFLRNRLTRLNLFEIRELQFSYPLFFIEKQQLTKQGQLNLLINSRKFWENNLELYDWHFLHFSDSRWQDFVDFLKVPTMRKITSRTKMLFNFWPSLYQELYNESFYSSDSYIDYFNNEDPNMFAMEISTPPQENNNQLPNSDSFFDEAEDYNRYSKFQIPSYLSREYWRGFLYYQSEHDNLVMQQYVSNSTRFSFKEMVQQVTFHENDLLLYPEMFPLKLTNKKNVQKFQKDMKFDFEEDQKILMNPSVKDFNSFLNLYTENFYEIRQTLYNTEVMRLNESLKKNLPVSEKRDFVPAEQKLLMNSINVPKGFFLQRFVPKKNFFFNFPFYLFSKNKHNYNEWFYIDNQFFLTSLSAILLRLNNSHQSLSKNFLLFHKINKPNLSVLVNQQSLKQFFFTKNDVSFFLLLLKQKFTSSKEITIFIMLLQLYGLNKFNDKVYPQKLLNFINKLFFFRDLIILFEEPLTHYWYTFFNTLEIGEYTTQKYISKNIKNLNVFVPAKYYSLSFLLYSFFSENEQKLLTSLFNNSTNLTQSLFCAKQKKEQLKYLNNLILSLFCDYSFFQQFNLYISYNKVRNVEKQQINYFFFNLNQRLKNNLFVKYFKTFKYIQHGIDNFCQMQSFFALTFYQLETCSITNAYNFWKYTLILKFCLLVCLCVFFNLFFSIWFFLSGSLIGFILFFIYRFYVNKAYLNNFTASTMSLLTIYFTQYKESIFAESRENAANIQAEDSHIQSIWKYLYPDLTNKIGEPLPVLFLFPTEILVAICQRIEFHLREMFIVDNLSKYEQMNLNISFLTNLKKNSSLNFQNVFYKNQCLIYSGIRKNYDFMYTPSYSFNFWKGLPQNEYFFNDFMLPHEMSVNALENYAFLDLKNLKNLTLYWGMPVSNDKANRHPLFYVLQLSENFRKYRVSKYKFFSKWFFF